MNTERTIGASSRWKLGEKLGEGAYSEVYSAVDSNNNVVAVKIQRPMSISLCHENAMYNQLNSSSDESGVSGIPRKYHYDKVRNRDILVLECFGPSIQDFFETCRGPFSPHAAFWVGLQALKQLEFVHRNGIIHRDIKTENIVVGRENKLTLHLIDFGGAKQYIDDKTGEHIPFKRNQQRVGNPVFSSTNAHDGFELSRRDDLISLGYVLVFLLRRTLPWGWIRNSDLIRMEKRNISPEKLCKGLPQEMTRYLRHAFNLNFQQTPDYEYLKGMFEQQLHPDVKSWENGSFDWIAKTEIN